MNPLTTLTERMEPTPQQGGFTSPGWERFKAASKAVGTNALGVLPGSGDVMSAQDSMSSAKNALADFQGGRYGSGAKNALWSLAAAAGALPMVPQVFGGIKKAEGVMSLKPGGGKQYDFLLPKTDELDVKFPEKINNINYIKRSLELGKDDKKYHSIVSFDADGGIIGAAAIHPTSDSMRIETMGGIGGGGGSKVLKEAIRQSEAKGFGGAITLTPVRDPATVEWYISQGFDVKPGSRYGEFYLPPTKKPKVIE